MMKQPYFQERSLLPRVEKYMSEHDHVDLEKMTDYLMTTYREFHRKSRNSFVQSVEKAYMWYNYCHAAEGDDSDIIEDVADSDGGGPDILEISDPQMPQKKRELNTVISNMYKSPSSRPISTSNNRKNESFCFIDTKGNNSPKDFNSSQKRKLKKRKPDTEEEIEELITKKKKRQLQPEEIKISYAQMAGIESLEDKIRDLMANLLRPGVLQPLLKSVLVTGPSGSGKTTFTQALAGTTKSPLLRVTATELVGGVSGESEERIREIFEQASYFSPCVLLIEKIDGIFPKDTTTKSLEKRIASQLSACLTNMKSKYKEKRVIVVGETSWPENLDWDLRSSFDEEIFMAIPSEQARSQILQLLCEEPKVDIDYKEVAYRTPGYVAGDLKKLMEKAQSLASKRKKELLFGSSEGTSTIERLNSFMYEFMKLCDSDQFATPEAPNMEDFMEALLHITPALKREGFPSVPDVTWKDIGGLEDVKKELREKILEPIQYAKLHEEYGANRPNGILMWGPPGCGKTLLAKAVANEAGINLLPVMGPELLSMYQGESERAVREVFRRARNVAPCVIFFDEFDSLCPVRSKGVESGSKTTIVNTLLTEMNGFSKREDVYVIAATNRPDILDPAVTRPGRFDTLLYVDVPDDPGRVAIFRACTKNGTCPCLAPDVNLEEVSQLCNNFSGADCDHLVYLASKEAIREVIHSSESVPQTVTSSTDTLSASKQRFVAKKHMFAALKKIKPSISLEEQRRYKKLYKKIEGSRVQGASPGFPEELPPLAANIPDQADEMDTTDGASL
ncbi:hypothetical protein Pcinc_017278 [Petrolisthes cinctipes]|uniref:AAA+ ATPase domain-containing protein n=1 Tax=Petrolisthes cinctipes TaxID=88211 RepID=A0AAE1FQL9_PETCI|nr:hypothetical protein Pcinc_017278 [Petrolisthes cinctipes]